MTRVELITPQHKALRNLLGRIIFYAGNSDFQKTVELQYFRTLIHEFSVLFTDHHQAEHGHIIQLANARYPREEDFDTEMYQSLHSIFGHVVQDVTKLGNGDEETEMDFYYTLLGFEEIFGGYMRMQEQMTESTLKHYYSREELMEEMEGLIQRMSDPILLLWSRYIVPAQRENESVLFLSVVAKVRRPEIYQNVLQAVQAELYPARYNSIIQKINNTR